PSAQAIVARVLSEFPRPIHTIRPNLPAHIERTLAAGLAKLAADRPPTARHFVEMLTRPTAERRWAARPRWQIAALAALVLGGAGGPEWDRLPVGERLGARARQRGRGDRHAQAGRFFPARTFPERRFGPDRQRLGVGGRRNREPDRPTRARDQRWRVRYPAQERDDRLS